jgi:outer membrane protein assembly factor BamB
MVILGLLAVMLTAIGVHGAALTNDWAAWRGPLANGVSTTANPPVTWSETNNVRWKIEVPGKGHSSPIVFGERIYLTTAVPVGEKMPAVFDDAPGVHDSVPVTHRHQFVVMAIHRRDGTPAWKRVATEAWPHEGGHYTGSLASNSPVTDGEMLYVNFGSRGLYAYDLEGNLKWKKDLGKMHTLHAHGEGSSPVIHKDALIVCWDHEADSFLYKLDKRTGKEIWKVARDEKTAWATPLIVEHKGRTQIVTSATKRVRGYDFETGELIWEWKGLAMNAVSSPVASDGIVITGNSYDFAAMVAVKLDEAKGDVTDTKHVAWTLNRLTPYVSSPLLYGDTLYFLRHNQNVLSRMDPVTGKFRGDPIRLTGIRDFIFASPVGAANRIYIPSRDGVTVVLSHDSENKQLAANRLNDSFSASPALAGRELYLRGEKFLYCIAE